MVDNSLRRKRARPLPDVALTGNTRQVSTGCLWIDGDLRKSSWRYCQKPREPGSSWCAEHKAQAFVEAPRRREVFRPKRWSRFRAS